MKPLEVIARAMHAARYTTFKSEWEGYEAVAEVFLSAYPKIAKSLESAHAHAVLTRQED